MDINSLPVGRMKTANTEAFRPGSLVFTPYAWGGTEIMQLGVRVGEHGDVFALTPWFGGHEAAGTVVQPRSDRSLFGLEPNFGMPEVLFDPATPSLAHPDIHRAKGFVGLGQTGIHLGSCRRLDGMSSMTQRYPINPSTWTLIEDPNGSAAEVWFDAWILSFPLSDRDRFVTRIDRPAEG